MITKNFKLLTALNRLALNLDVYWTSFVAWNGDTVKKYSGYANYNVAASGLYDYMTLHPKVSQSDIPTNVNSSNSFSKRGVCFGNGTTPPTENDHCMEGDLLTNYGCSQTYEFSKDSITFTYTITNNGSDPFTISEVGLLGYAYVGNGNYRYYSSGILLDRTLLESPITIPAGGVGQLTYTIRMNGLDE